MNQMKKIAGKAVHAHERNMHPGKTPTKMAKGGVTNEMLLKHGRGMAKVINQGKVGK
jgi:hypothetical protein